MKYYVKEVVNTKEMDNFVRLPSKIYKDNPYYVPDLESDVHDYFGAEKWRKIWTSGNFLVTLHRDL